MEFIRTTHEPCGIYRCDCGEEFEVDPSTEENLSFNGERLYPQCPKCGDVDLLRDDRPLWLRVAVFPLLVGLVALHFSVCSALTILVHPERKRYKFYEYYSPWGWGKRKDHPNEGPPPITLDYDEPAEPSSDHDPWDG